jgi:hypothetical protein
MTDVIKSIVYEKIQEFETDYAEKDKSFDLIKEISALHMRIILAVAFGSPNLHKVKLPYIKKGETLHLDVGLFIRHLLSFVLFRFGRRDFAILPYLVFFLYSKEDKEYKQNI